MNQIWSKQYFGHKMFVVCKQLKEIKTALKELIKTKQLTRKAEISSANSKPNAFQSSLNRRLVTTIDLNYLATLKQEVIRINSRLESEAKQKSKNLWLKEENNNTSFFHKSIRNKQNLNKICSISDNNNIRLRDPQEVNSHIVIFYKDL